MKVITHQISIAGRPATTVSIAPGHELPAHVDYLGVSRGLHEGKFE